MTTGKVGSGRENGVEAPPSAPAPDNDADLMDAVRRGDDAAFASLVERHQRPLLNFFVLNGVGEHAEDLAQETFIRLYKYRAKYRKAAKFTTFLYLLARQVRIDFLRKTLRRAELHERLAEEAPQEEPPSAAARGMRIDAEAALRLLPDAMREVVVLSVMQGLTQGEVADVLHIPVGTVKSRLSIALGRLRAAMRDPDPS